MPDDVSYLRRGALALAAVAVAGYLVDALFNLGLTHFLAPHDYGDFKLAYSFATFFGLALLLGGDRAAPMVLAPCLERGEPRRVWEYLRFYLSTAGLLGVGLILITWSIAWMHVGTPHPGHHHPLVLAACIVPVNAAGAMVSRTLQSARRPAQAVVPWRLGLPLLQLALFAGLIAWRGTLTDREAILVGLVAVSAVTLWQWRGLQRQGLVETAPDPSFREHRAWLAASVPMMGAFLVALALNQSDLYFLEILGTEAEVGHYAAAATVAHVLVLAQVTVIGLLAPLARPAIEAGAEASRRVYLRGLRWLLAFLVPLAVLLALFAEPVLHLFGPQYAVGRDVLFSLAVGYFAWAAAALSALWLQYRGRAATVLAISVGTLIVDSILNLLLIPRYGMEGAAGSTALTLGVGAAAIVVAHLRAR
ncbi:MAG: polysaccharide biosynthesis C-terminal domain-containing protein [Thermoanaerobaculia bacterium]